jgi:hypothetical protein
MQFHQVERVSLYESCQSLIESQQGSAEIPQHRLAAYRRGQSEDLRTHFVQWFDGRS